MVIEMLIIGQIGQNTIRCWLVKMKHMRLNQAFPNDLLYGLCTSGTSPSKLAFQINWLNALPKSQCGSVEYYSTVRGGEVACAGVCGVVDIGV